MSKTIEIKKIHVNNFILSIILGFGVLFILENFGSLNSYYGRIHFVTFFDNTITIEGFSFNSETIDTKLDLYFQKLPFFLKAVVADFVYGIIFSIGFFLLLTIKRNYNFKIENNEPINSDSENRNISLKKESSVKLNSAKEDLTELKNKGIIPEEVYNEKISKIDEKISKENILETKEYKQLKSLYDSGIFTKEEFENKIDILKNKLSVYIDYKEFRIIDGFSEGLAVAINNTLDYGYVNEENEVVIDFVFEHAENFKNGIAKVRINREFKNIDLTGKVII